MSEPFGPVFAFDNYFGESDLASDPAAQAVLVKELGYGATYHSMNRASDEGWRKLCSWHDASKDAGLPVAAYYTVVKLGEEPPAGGHGVDEVIAEIPEGSTLELAVTIPGATPSTPEHDARAVEYLETLLAAAKPRRITLSLYHHIWFWMERIDDCVRLASRIDDPALRVTFCGYHWFAVDGSSLGEKLRLAAPWMALANLCGSRAYREDETKKSGLPRTIEPVGEGDFPLADFISGLREIDYRGPVGFQGYQIGGDPPDTLRRSIEAWNEAVST